MAAFVYEMAHEPKQVTDRIDRTIQERRRSHLVTKRIHDDIKLGPA